MKPGKIKEINKQVSEKLGLPEEQVTSVNDFYWSRVKRMVNELEGDEIYLHSLGSFKIKHWTLDDMIRKYNIIIESQRNNNQNIFNLYNSALARLKIFREKALQRKIKKLEYRNERIQNLEKQRKDI